MQTSVEKVKKAENSLEQSLIAQTPKLRGFIAGRVRSAHEIDDVLQETMARTLRSADKHTLVNPIAYAMTVAKTVMFEHWRHGDKAAHIPISEEEMGMDASSSLETTQLNRAQLKDLSDIVDAMPSLRREVFIRRRLEGQSREEIAGALGISLDAVKKHINRALVDIAAGMEKRGWYE